MRTAGGNILVLSFALLASAQKEKCSSPLEFPHTKLNAKFSSRLWFNSGEKVYYHCGEDFTPSEGVRSVQCVDGKWTKLSLKCKKRMCGNVGDLANGHFQYEGNAYIGEKVYAVCNEGFTLRGMDYLICKKSGWAGKLPSCEEGETTCSTPAVDNSVLGSGGASVRRLGESMNITCKQGFQLEGAPQITCGPSGQWQPQPPRCLPSDKDQQPSGRGRGRCSVPLTVSGSNANLADKYITMTSFASGDKVYYVCDVGYSPVRGSRSRSCIDGKWTKLNLKCEPKLCGSAGEILNGQFVYTGVEFGDTATAVCNDGYVLVGQATRHCMSKGWDGRVPDCEVVKCENEPKMTNAERRGPEEQPYIYRSVFQYRCRQGTLVGPREIWCTKNGTWSASPPECKDITCPSPNVHNAFWIAAQNQKYRPMDTILIECKPGYTIFGPNSIICSHEGRWLPRLPQCRLSYYNWRG